MNQVFLTSKRLAGSLGRFPAWSGRHLAAAALALGLSSCQSANLGIEPGTQQPQIAETPQLSPDPKGEVFGQGSVRITLLVPATAPGNAAVVASEIRNGALMAMQDFGNSTIQLVIKDTKGQPAEAQETASQAVSEGSSAVLGPLFSGSVGAASAVTLPAGKTIIAFSTDAAVARRNVYLLSFTPQADTQRMISHAISTGRRSIFAFLPNSQEGNLREAVLRQVAGQAGVTVQTAKYDRSTESIEAVARDSAAGIETADSLYIPEGGQVPSVLLASLRRSGANVTGKQVLGSGQWESVKFGDKALEGALYAGRDITNFTSFASRYEATYNAKPSVMAASGYDSVTLVTTLVRARGAQAFQPETLEDRRGFSGVNGIFRFRQDGTAERGLAIYQVVAGAGQLVSPAPTSFSGS